MVKTKATTKNATNATVKPVAKWSQSQSAKGYNKSSKKEHFYLKCCECEVDLMMRNVSEREM